jgi:hypothetical protein
VVGKFPASRLRATRSIAAAKIRNLSLKHLSGFAVTRVFVRFPILRQEDFSGSWLALQKEAFLTSFLLAHCGGGQDKPGCLGPSAKLPRHFFSFRFLQVPFSNFYFLFSKGGRSFPAASLASARSRPRSSSALNRPSRYSPRSKSSARRSPFCELHSEHEDTRLR